MPVDGAKRLTMTSAPQRGPRIHLRLDEIARRIAIQGVNEAATASKCLVEPGRDAAISPADVNASALRLPVAGNSPT